MRSLLRYARVKKDTKNRNAVLKLVVEFFGGNVKKAELWMNSRNPLLGNITPEFMISVGRSDRLLKFVKNCIAENQPPCA